MDLILLDELLVEEISEIKNAKEKENVNLFNLENVNLFELNNYNNITIYTGLNLNFISNKFINFVKEIIKIQDKKVQFNVVLVEKFGENSKIVVDWFNFINQTYQTKFYIKSEISRENLKEEINFIESVSKPEKMNNSFIKDEIPKENSVTIYTDGACSGNPGAGGWGAVLIRGDYERRFSGFEKETTNNKMEITAVIEALKMLKAPCNVELYSDSAYVVNAINLGWLENWKKNSWLGSDKKPVKNIEYWQTLDSLLKIHNVKFIKVKGHSDNKYNNICDELATGEIAKNSSEI